MAATTEVSRLARAQRRLAVLVFTDIVGSTSQRQRLGEIRFGEQRALLDVLQYSLVDEFEGEVVKHLGDGVMAAFASASAAARFGTVLQDELARLNTRLADPIVLRVGIAAGETERRDGDYFGMPAVEAARLCNACTGEEVLVTPLVTQLGGELVADLVVGPRQLHLKGIEGEFTAWELRSAPADEVVPVPVALRGDDRFGFVGREAELAQLRSLFDRAADGHLGAVLVTGEAGVGKTRLVAELARHAHDRGATVLFGHNDEDVTIPYQPVTEALRAFLDQRAGEGAARLLGKRRGELVRLIPTLAEEIASLPPPVSSDPDTERLWLFEAVVGWLVAASARRPIVLVLDDLHWAGRPTMQLVRHLLASPQPMSVLVVMTSRDPSGAPAPVGPLAGIGAADGPVHVPLASFDLGTLEHFLEQAAGHELDERALDLARLLHAETGGNALFVRELVLHLSEGGAIARRDGRWVVTVPDLNAADIPDGVRRAVAERVARLSDPARLVLEWSSIIGRQSDHHLLVEVSGLDDETVIEALEECVGARLLVEVATGRFQFVHALVRSALYADLGPTRRAVRHRKVAQALERDTRRRSTGAIAALAHHFTAGGSPEDRRQAIGYSFAAGVAALDQLAHESAIRFLRQAVGLLDDLGDDQPGDGALRCDVLVSLGRALFQVGDPSYDDVLQTAAEIAERISDPGRLGAALLAADRGGMTISGTVQPERVRRLELALAGLDPADSALRSRLLATLSSEVHFAGDPGRMTAVGDEALAMARRLDDPTTLGFVLMHRASSFRLAEHLEERLLATEELQRISRSIGDPVLEFNGTFRHLEAALEAGDARGLDAGLATVLRLADELRQPALVRTALRVEADVHLLRGALDLCESTLHRMWAVADAAGLGDATTTTFTGMFHNLRSLQGRPEDSLEWWERCIAYREVAGFRLGWALSAVEIDPEQSLAVYDEYAAGRFEGIRRDLTWRATMTYVTKLCLLHGRLEHAEMLVELLRPFERQVIDSGSGIKGSVGLPIGRLLTALGRYDEAEAALHRAGVVHRRIGAVLLEATTDLALAEVHLGRRRPGDEALAENLLVAASGTAARHGAHGLVTDADRLRKAMT